MQPGTAFRALEALIASRRETGLVADIDWTVLFPALEMRGRHLLAAEVAEGVASAPQTADASFATQWLDAVRNLPSWERRERLLDFVGREARQIFGMMPEDPIDESRGLFELGMDSLMSVRLKRRLESGTGMRLPGTVTLTYPSVAALAEYLEGKLFPFAEAPAVQSLQTQTSIPSASVEEMSELETNTAIAAELAAIQQKLGVL
jgi:acyl carrier protein